MSYEPPQSPHPPSPGTPTGPQSQPVPPPAGYPPQGYGTGPGAPPPSAYTAPAPARVEPRPAMSGRHLTALLLICGTALLLLADLVAAFTAGTDGFDIDFVDRLFLLGAAGGGFFFSIPTILILSLLVIAALRLREGSTGPFDRLILILALVVSALVTLFTLLALFGSFGVDGLDPRVGFILLLLGALAIAAAVTWYAFGEYQTSRPARPTPGYGPGQGYQPAYQPPPTQAAPPPGTPPPAQGYPPTGYPPQG
jgi:hypothetical protein